MDDDELLDDAPCPFCWALRWLDQPCPGHRLLQRRATCEDLR